MNKYIIDIVNETYPRSLTDECFGHTVYKCHMGEVYSLEIKYSAYNAIKDAISYIKQREKVISFELYIFDERVCELTIDGRFLNQLDIIS